MPDQPTSAPDPAAMRRSYDLGALDDTLTEVSEVLGHLPEHAYDSLDVRRSIALGILAD